MHFAYAVVVSLCLLVSPAFAARVTLSGQVTYRERIALPELATLEIQLVDETLPSLPPRLDVRAPIAANGGVPLSFTLAFEDALILPTHNYALIAAISANGGLLFRNFEPYAVNPLAPVEPVLIVTNLVGQVQEQSAMSSAATTDAPPALLDSIWMAVSIGDKPILPGTRPSITIGADMRAGGNGSCNSWFAPAQIDGDRLTLGSITATQKGCTQSVNLQEAAFKAALAATMRWQVSGDELTLFGSDGKALLLFRR